MSLVPYEVDEDSDDVEASTSSRFNLRDVLHTEEGEEIRKYYEKHQCLSPKMARLLVNMIANNLLDRNLSGSRKSCKDISSEICMFFVKEEMVNIN